MSLPVATSPDLTLISDPIVAAAGECALDFLGNYDNGGYVGGYELSQPRKGRWYSNRNNYRNKKQDLQGPPRPSSSSPTAELPRPVRKSRKNFRKTNRNGQVPAKPTTQSPSAASRCSMVSIATTSSGLSSGASSMRALYDPHDTPPSDAGLDSVVKSSSSSAASSAGFCDLTSNEDVDEEDFSEHAFFDDPLSCAKSLTYSRQWSCPLGSETYPVKNSRSKKPPRRQNYPNLANPAIKQFFNEQRAFYRKIYDQQFAVISAIQLATATEAAPENGKPSRVSGYIPHQHLGLPPLPPPIGSPTPWMYPDQGCLGPNSPEHLNPCEEAFLTKIKLHAIPKKLYRTPPLKKDVIPGGPAIPSPPPKLLMSQTISLSVQQLEKQPSKPLVQSSSTLECPPKSSESKPSVEPQYLAARADFHQQIRERLLGKTTSTTVPSSIPATSVLLSTTTVPKATSYASVIASSGPKIPEAPKPLNSITLPPSVAVISILQNENNNPRRNGTKKGGKKTRNGPQKTKPDIEFCMQDNDFPPMMSTTTPPMKDFSKLSITTTIKDTV